MRLEALAELAKEGTIDREEYVRQTKLLGGDVKSTHLVKGLDYALLEKVRRGEDVMAGEEAINEDEEEAEDEDMEDKLERVLEQEVVPVERKEEKKKGVQAAPIPKTRTEILAALKESRRVAKEAAQPSLGAKFKKIGQPKVKAKEKPKEEEEEKEKVKYVTLPNGRVKKMVKREKPKKVELEAPDPMSAPLGMMPPPPKPSVIVEEEDDDIFEGAGAEYDPLAGLQDDSSSSDEEGEAPESKKLKPENEQDTPSTTTTSTTSPSTTSPSATTMPPPPPPPPKTNYFNEPISATPDSSTYTPPSASSLLSDPALVAALAKASALRPLSSSSSSADAEKAKRHAALLESADRDAFDVDFGFGGSRDFGDEDDDDGYQTKKKGGAKRKRGGEKKVKKGDKNDAGVVGKIVEERYGKGK